MSNLVVVALPEEGESVYGISSEKVPHMTLLFLGENGNHPKRGEIAAFIEHAASTMLTTFWMDVERRGELGDDKADVLFFSKRANFDYDNVKEFRAQLLKFDTIKTLYDSVEQYPEWTPHLTLGYPETPAKSKDERVYTVKFDRIALWDSNYDGPEILLKDYWTGPTEVSMSTLAEVGSEFLAHYGVKGMKWGVRKDRTSEVGARETRSLLRGKTKVKTSGGKGQPATQDAIKAAKQKQKLKKSGMAAMSNQELRELQERLNLEENVKRLSGSEGKKFVQGLVKEEGKQTVRTTVQSKTRKKK